LFRLPANVLQAFKQGTGWTNNTTSLVSEQLYIVEPALYYNTTVNRTLIFTLIDGLVVEIPNYELAAPLRGIDPSGKRVL